MCASIRPRSVVLVLDLPAFLSFLYLAATWPQTHIRARGKGVTHILSLADQTQVMEIPECTRKLYQIAKSGPE